MPLFDKTIEKRLLKVRARMRERSLDALVIYAGLEHGLNFECLVGLRPRFEEALLVLHANVTAQLVLGNENLNKCDRALIEAIPTHAPHFSLPSQPMENTMSFTGIFG